MRRRRRRRRRRTTIAQHMHKIDNMDIDNHNRGKQHTYIHNFISHSIGQAQQNNTTNTKQHTIQETLVEVGNKCLRRMMAALTQPGATIIQNTSPNTLLFPPSSTPLTCSPKSSNASRCNRSPRNACRPLNANSLHHHCCRFCSVAIACLCVCVWPLVPRPRVVPGLGLLKVGNLSP